MNNSKQLFRILAILSVLLWAGDFQVFAQEDFIVTLGKNKTFTAYNITTPTAGNAVSVDGIAESTAYVGPYQSAISKAAAGVRFAVIAEDGGPTEMDATISIKMTYTLLVDFNALPPSERGGGSASAHLYGWIVGPRVELDYINFIHYSDFAERTQTITHTRKLSDLLWPPSQNKLAAGGTYEVGCDIYTHAQIYIGTDALSYARVTIDEIKILFKCDFTSNESGDIERCFGGIGPQCKGVPLPFKPNYDTCVVDGYASVGSILHDNCCLRTNNDGYSCLIPYYGNHECRKEWEEAEANVACSLVGNVRIWPQKFGPYLTPNDGDHMSIKAPSGAPVNPKYESLCITGSCLTDPSVKNPKKPKPLLFKDGCGFYCICE